MNLIEEIKNRLDIVALISETTPLKKGGNSWQACCPFHNEKNPSFHVFEDTQRWHCFGACAEGGDLIDFYKKLYSLEAGEAIQKLADKAGIKIEERPDAHKYDRLYELLNCLAEFFHNNLREYKPGRLYLSKRGFNAESVKNFRIGYALESWDSTLKCLAGSGFSSAEMLEAGVVKEAKTPGRYYDVFRNRITIPITDTKGRIVGFGGRALAAEDRAKYLNSPRTPLFDKGALLFGLDRAKTAIRESGIAVIVEGYMDTIMAHQYGFTNVIAQMGTALTDVQARTLGKYTTRVHIALDADEAGSKAAFKDMEVAARIALADRFNFDLAVVALPAGKDPDEVIRESPDGWREMVNKAQQAADYVIERGTATLQLEATVRQREAVAYALLPILTATEHELSRASNIQKLAARLRFPEATLIAWARQQKLAKPGDKKQIGPITAPVDQPIERKFLSLYWGNGLFHRTTLTAQFEITGVPWLTMTDFSNPLYGYFFEAIEQGNPITDAPVDRTEEPDLMLMIKLALDIKKGAYQRQNQELLGLVDKLEQFQGNMKAITAISRETSSLLVS